MEGWLIAGFVTQFVLYLSLVRVLNRWIECQKAHLRDDLIPPTRELILIWRKQIRLHKKGTPTYESYRRSLVKAGLTQYGD